MSGRVRPPVTTAGFLPLSGRPARDASADLRGPAEFAPVRTVRRRRPWRRYVLLLVGAYCVWMGAREWAAYHSLRQDAAQVESQVATLRGQAAQLRAQIAYAHTNAYIAAAARQEFGLVTPNEVPLAPLPPTGRATPKG